MSARNSWRRSTKWSEKILCICLENLANPKTGRFGWLAGWLQNIRHTHAHTGRDTDTHTHTHWDDTHSLSLSLTHTPKDITITHTHAHEASSHVTLALSVSLSQQTHPWLPLRCLLAHFPPTPNCTAQPAPSALWAIQTARPRRWHGLLFSVFKEQKKKKKKRIRRHREKFNRFFGKRNSIPVKNLNDLQPMFSSGLIYRQEAILAAISEKDAHLALLEMNGPKKPKVMEEIGRLNKEKDQLQIQLRDVVRKYNEALVCSSSIFFGRERRSRGGLMESRLRHRCRGGPHPPPSLADSPQGWVRQSRQPYGVVSVSSWRTPPPTPPTHPWLADPHPPTTPPAWHDNVIMWGARSLRRRSVLVERWLNALHCVR